MGVQGGSGLQLEPVVYNGVLVDINVSEGGIGYSPSDHVTIFDMQNSAKAGYGARAELVLDENGSVIDLNILNGGQNYDPRYLEIYVMGSDTDSKLIQKMPKSWGG